MSFPFKPLHLLPKVNFVCLDCGGILDDEHVFETDDGHGPLCELCHREAMRLFHTFLAQDPRSRKDMEHLIPYLPYDVDDPEFIGFIPK